MTVNSHLNTFLNKKVETYSPAAGILAPATIVYRLENTYADQKNGTSILNTIDAFAKDPKAGEITELIIGAFDFQSADSIDGIVDRLVGLKDTFTSLKAIFIGDMTSEDCEISWIQQSDLSPLLEAYPGLEHLQVRGGDGLSFGNLAHDHLRTLIIETGGLPSTVIKEVMNARLPQLERLDLWLGSDNYGFDAKIEDFSPLLSGQRFPELRHLGLMNSEIQDEVAAAVAQAPVLQQLKVLDLSMGTLTDTGGAALLNSKDIKRLDFLNLRRHYLSEEMMTRLKQLGIRINLDDQEEPEDDDYRYAEVTE